MELPETRVPTVHIDRSQAHDASTDAAERRVPMVVVLAVSDDESSWRAAAFVGRLTHDDDTVVVVNVSTHGQPQRHRAGEFRTLDWIAYATMALLPPVAPIVPPTFDDDSDDAPPGASGSGDEFDDLPDHLGDDVVVLTGDPVVRICGVADEVDADLIVVGTSDRGVWSRIFSGESVSRGVADASSRSVLLVR